VTLKIGQGAHGDVGYLRETHRLAGCQQGVLSIDRSRARGADGQGERPSGHPVEAAAKCIVLIVKIGRKTSRFILAVVPGNARVDTVRVKSLFNGATYAGFAATDVAERLAGSVAGTVLPFTLQP